MSFLTSGAFTDFTPNTRAKSAEVDANFAALYKHLFTTTSDILIGSCWQKVVSTAASHTLVSTDSIRALCIDVNTSTGYTVTLPTASVSQHRMLSLKNIGASGVLTIDGAGAETIDGQTTAALTAQYSFLHLHCDGTRWHIFG